MKKVLFFIHMLGNGGAQTLVRDYCLFFDRSKAEPVVLCAKRGGFSNETALEEAGIRVYYCSDHYRDWPLPLPFPLLRLVHVFERIYLCREFIRRERPDILHTHLQVNLFAALSCPRRPVRLFHTLHNEPEKQWRGRGIIPYLDYWAVRYLRRRYGLSIISLHERMREKVSRMFPGPPGYVLFNGIDLSMVGRDILKEKEVALLREKGLPEDAFIVGHVGRFTEQKNHAFLLDVFSEVLKRRKDAFLLLIGGDGEKRAEIEERLSRQYGKEQYLLLSDRKDVPELMRCMDVLLLPSLWEGLPMTLLEAQAVGLPCLVSERVVPLQLSSARLRCMRLSRGASAWAKAAIYESRDRREVVGLGQYDIRRVLEGLMGIYGI